MTATSGAEVFDGMGGGVVSATMRLLPVCAEDNAVRVLEMTFGGAGASDCVRIVPFVSGLAVGDVVWVAAEACGADGAEC